MCAPPTSTSCWASTSSQLKTDSDTQARESATWSSNNSNPRRSGGPTTVGLGLIPTSSSEPEASLGEDPMRGTLYQTLSLLLSKPCMKQNKNLQNSENPKKNA